ncbi:SULT1B1 [Branchiostoma lanceolatum]|uniref:Sulfotransferase n=1 Tax=Branchiostoma lanceolatum TaxID=7740 RepID=A0A8K0A2U4_BRALA|nr:SULT1B1 [Branchiostoma lanceolatum]
MAGTNLEKNSEKNPRNGRTKHGWYKFGEELLFEYKGTIFPDCATKENLDAMPDFHVRDDDVIVVGFPKAGNHWCAEIVNNVMRAAGKTSEATIDQEAPGRILEFDHEVRDEIRTNHRFLEGKPSPRLICTHLHREFAPHGIASPKGNTKIISIMRNPKDTVVSYYHFANRIGCNENDWETFADDFLNGRWEYGDFYRHVLGWWPMRDNPNFLFLKYEDMKKNMEGAIKKVATFLEAELKEDQVARIMEACTFRNMKVVYDKATKVGYRSVLARKGVMGDWKSMFTDEQNAAFDAKYKENLEGTGLSFDFE